MTFFFSSEGEWLQMVLHKTRPLSVASISSSVSAAGVRKALEEMRTNVMPSPACFDSCCKVCTVVSVSRRLCRTQRWNAAARVHIKVSVSGRLSLWRVKVCLKKKKTTVLYCFVRTQSTSLYLCLSFTLCVFVCYKWLCVKVLFSFGRTAKLRYIALCRT